jgi:hypothetical protein
MIKTNPLDLLELPPPPPLAAATNGSNDGLGTALASSAAD